jgi:hypothetical protein
MGSVAVGSLAVAAVCYFDLPLADAAEILKLHQPFFFVVYCMMVCVLRTIQE